MSIERVLQIGLVAIATLAGYLTHSRAGAPAPSPQPTTARPSPSNQRAGVVARNAQAPRGWRRPTGEPGMTFEPALVDPEQLPQNELPTDEPRNPAWAEPMEHEMSRLLDRKLAQIFPDLSATVRCRSTTCRVEMEIPPNMIDKVVGFLTLAVPLGQRMRPSSDRRDAATVDFALEVDLTKTPTLDEWRQYGEMFEESRQAQIEALIKGEKEGKPWFSEP